MWLVRHGESESNAGLPTNGPAAAPLTALGRRQAERVAAQLPESPALIVSSPFVRARQTARATVERFPDVAYEEWPVQEFTYLGRLHAPQTTAEQRRPHSDAYWQRCDPAYVNGGNGESFKAVIARARAFLDRAAHHPVDGPIAVFSHGLFIKTVMWTLLTGVTDPSAADMRTFRHFDGVCYVPNGTIVELRRSGGEDWRVVAGGTAHLPELSTAPETAAATRLD
ncbi:phosphoglycerate kinase [Actinomadura rubrobrunea]|uniref:Phosphoglycerate kinase n=1 Tax=Actinomadura rubrobrunea TaxID=115335 RepID=A0A9W6UXX9_9ACTN|nr:phosphoglycerate kinase [Actinomadura rubrobrunea]